MKPASSVHMAFMRFAIDAVFLDREMHVVEIAADLKPVAIGRCARVEVGAGDSGR